MRGRLNGWSCFNCNSMYVAFNRTALAMWEVFKKVWRGLTESYEPSQHYFKGKKNK